MFESVIFREYDIRGVYNKQFDLKFAQDLGRTYATYIKKNPPKKSGRLIAVGGDARLSSPEIVNSVIKGLNESGFDVLNLGLVTSPISYFATFTVENVIGAIMVTGSHNPPEFNGFKISVGSKTIFGEAIQDLRRIMEKGDYVSGTGTVKDFDIFPSYLERYKQEFGNLSKLKVILDCGNGAAGCIARKLFVAAGLDVELLFEEPDGRFPNHHPDPTVESNLVALKKRVLETGAAVGIGFDGDADRIGVLDEKGRMLYGDELMVIISRAILAQNPGQKIIGDVKCSDRLFADIKNHGGQPIMWKTGHSLIKEKIREESAPFGGEMSGHIFFADRNYGYDDALYAGLRVCEILSKTKKPLSSLLDGLPPAFNTPEIRVDTTEEKKVLIVDKLKAAFPVSPKSDYAVDLTDGVRVSFKDGWALARSSNTQPVLVLRYESSTENGLNQIRQRFQEVVEKYL